MSDTRPSAPAGARATARAVLASVIGNAFEWFDFLIFGFFASLIANAYFPVHEAFVASLVATSTFAISYAVRPFGGILLGLYADRVGRKPALTVMILMMGLSTLLIGATPSYAMIGLAAPILAILARVLQGLSVGGEFASATAMLVEYAPSRRRMLYGSLQMCSQALAISVAASFGYFLSKKLSIPNLEQWGWRIPFLLGVLIVPVGVYIRRRVSESPLFNKTSTPIPFRALLTHHMGALIAGFGVVVVGTVSNYLWFIYMPMFVVQQLNLPFEDALLGALICGFILFALCPLAGMLADRVGAKKVFITGTVLFGIISYPLFAFVVVSPTMAHLISTQIVIAVVICLIWGPTPGLMAGLFPSGVRSTGMAICYNLGVLLFGGLAPLTLTTAVEFTGDRMIPAYYIIVSAVIAIVALLWGNKVGRRCSARAEYGHLPS